MRWRSAIATGLVSLAALSGCDKLFSVLEVEQGSDAAVIADADDAATVDSSSCVETTVHDEDLDEMVDNCDACPTVPSTLTDTDGDGLTNECDPDLSVSSDGDAIYLASVFKSSAELSADYDTGGTASAAVVDDGVLLPAGAQIQLKVPIIPTKIVAVIRTFAGASSSDVLRIAANGVSCDIGAAGCAGETGKICFSLDAVGTTTAIPASSINEVALWHDSAGLHCSVLASGTRYQRDDAAGTFINSIPFIRVTGAMVELDSLVFYVEK